METESQKQEIQEQKEMLEALKRLHKHADFILWREKVAKPLIAQWEAEELKADELPEVVLRANLKVKNTIKSLFYTWFESIE